MTDARCPHTRTLSYATGEYAIHLGYAELTTLIDLAFAAWDSIPDASQETGDRFEDLVEHIAALRQWTGAPAEDRVLEHA